MIFLSYQKNSDNTLNTFLNAFGIGFILYWVIIVCAAIFGLLYFNIQTTWINQNIGIIIFLSFVVGLLIAFIRIFFEVKKKY